VKYTEAILSNNTQKLLWFEISKIPIAVLKNKFTVSFVIIFGTLSFPIASKRLEAFFHTAFAKLVVSSVSRQLLLRLRVVVLINNTVD